MDRDRARRRRRARARAAAGRGARAGLPARDGQRRAQGDGAREVRAARRRARRPAPPRGGRPLGCRSRRLSDRSALGAAGGHGRRGHRRPEREVVVVTDPHYNTLVSHEIVGHPAELDRALKMETAYAGRSWLLADLDAHQVGRRIASPLVTAYSDPALPGYGHYAYDHEGTPARRVTHIDRGVFRGFMNSRQTAAVFG